MDIQEVIRRKLRDVCDREFEGMESRMATAMGIPQGGMWRFMNENTGLNMMSIQRIFDYLGGKVTFDAASSPRYATVKRYKMNADLTELNGDEPIVFRKDWVERITKCQFQDLIAIETDVEVMSPTIEPGDSILVAKCEWGQELSNGAIYLIKYHGHYYIKRFRQAVDGSFIFLSDNRRMFWEDLTFKPIHLHLVEVVGRVIWIGREMV
jgi:hypothetical protein